MATVASGGIVPLKLHTHKPKPPLPALLSPFLGKKLNLKASPRTLVSNTKALAVVASGGGEFLDAVHNLVLGVGVGLPCTVMECGDIIYRSTLPKPSGLQLTVPGALLALSTLSYLWATPGVAPGFFDMFVLAFVERLFRPSFRKDDFVLGKKLGEGAFGVVYRVSLADKPSPKNGGDLVVKKATEYGAVEIWMNERVRRACASSCADFVHGFLESSSKKGAEYWLIWRFEGEATLFDLMQSKEFPYNVETMILGEVQNLPKGLERENKIIQTIMRQLLFALDGLHSTGIVHRDIKPQNIIFSEGSRTFKIIDLGAAADLRVRCTRTVYHEHTNSICTLRSSGHRTFSRVMAGLRSDSGLIQFNRQLKRCDYDLNAWRKSVEARAGPDLRKGFELLDLDNGIGWELLTSMVRYKARQRISAKAALAHPYFDREGLLALSFMQNLRMQLFRATQQDYGEAAKWIVQLMAKSGTEKEGGFTEAQLQELRERQEPKKKASPQRNALASALRLQRKIVRTLNESMDELNRRRKSLWWSRWIPREE
ncbi:Serine/threonine-protein kinase stn7, chloroplastic [Turnera subulata]|uniref:Serine/threonine-protein kinase stn7, chloroplastic n=1 Tax=Turnera subulata TaxID=218843 RepID=A0A9Q0G2Z4_9ROSI|nr:Serine/threonine-protein kinase stn7, chloroplastic [Turnera subulata]